MAEKMYTAREAGLAVLAKAHEMLKKSALAKADVPAAPPAAAATPAAPAAAPAKGGAHTSPTMKGPLKLATFMGRMDHKRKAKTSGVESDMDHGSKRGPEGYSKYQEQAQNQKGVHTPVSGVTQFPGGKGTSAAGDAAKDRYNGKAILNDHAKDAHRKVIAEQKAMPKPKLPG